MTTNNHVGFSKNFTSLDTKDKFLNPCHLKTLEYLLYCVQGCKLLLTCRNWMLNVNIPVRQYLLQQVHKTTTQKSLTENEPMTQPLTCHYDLNPFVLQQQQI